MTMNSASQTRKSPRRAVKRKSIADNSQMGARKRKSILLQHSISLNIPIEDVSQCSGLNCFVNYPDQIFSLTYLTENDTQNPESLKVLEDFKVGSWQAYLVGLLYNFSYQPAQRKALERAIVSGLRTKFQNSKVDMTFYTQVSRCKALSPTENDSEALKVTVVGRSETKEQLLYEGYVISWCSTIKESQPFLPVMLCRGNATYRDLVNSIVSEKFDVTITKLMLTQEELKYLSTYCLIMLDENDGFHAEFSYRLHTGDTIKLAMSTEPLLRLWKKIHQDDSIEIDLEEVELYQQALDSFYESTFGIKLGSARLKMITVRRCFCLQANSRMWFKSTKVIHVVLKYLNYLAIKRLREKALNNYFDEGNVDAECSVISH